MQLDDWVLCRIYKKTKKSSRGSAHKKEHVSQSQKECNGISTKQCANEDVLVEDTIRKLFEDMDADQYNNNNNQLGTQTINSSYQHSQNQFVNVPQSGDTLLHQIPTYAHHQQPSELGPLSHMGSNTYVHHQQAPELVNHNQVVEPSSYMGSTTFAQYQQTAFELGNHNQKDDSSSYMGNNMNIGLNDDQWEFSFPDSDDLFKCFLGF